jgi:hypothetical protein
LCERLAQDPHRIGNACSSSSKLRSEHTLCERLAQDPHRIWECSLLALETKE